MNETEKLKGILMGKRKRNKPGNNPVLSTGSTLLNLGCSDQVTGAYSPGHYYYYVGDSMSGKTWLSLSAFAEACLNPAFDDYQLVYDNPEQGALMDLGKYFGKAVKDRLTPPRVTKDGIRHSQTVEEFYYNHSRAVKRGPCIYVIDSMDALQSDDDIAKFEEQMEAFEQGKEVSGSYGVSKAKINSSNMREAVRLLNTNGSILIVISQTRDNLGFGFAKKTRAGGRSLRFYSTLEIWTSVKESKTKTVRKKKRQIGVTVAAQVKKNRVSGKDRTVDIPIYHSHGIDDVGSCVDYLVDENHWEKSKGGVIKAEELGFEGKRERLIHFIEEGDLEPDLRDITGDVWRDIERECRIARKNRY